MSQKDDKFELEVVAPASFSKRQLAVRGRFQIFVRPGSQYAIWNQFPSAVRYQIQSGDGGLEISPDLELSISEDGTSIFDEYAARPSNQVVSESYDEDIFDLLANFIDGPGAVKIRAVYCGVESSWVDVEILS